MERHINKTQKGTSLHDSVSFEPLCTKICWWVWPDGEFPKGVSGIN